MAHHDHSHSAAHTHQDHPYHLVNPSPYPIASSFALLVLTLSGAMYMHKVPFAGIGVIAGFLMVFACMFYWWREVIREGIKDKAHTPVVQHGLRMGMAMFIASEVMFFAAFFWAFFNASTLPKLPIVDDIWAIQPGVWPPAGIETLDAWHLPFMNTLILLLSGTTVTWAHYALLEKKWDDMKTALWLTVLLGISFTGLQAFEYGHAMFKFTDGIYASTFYMATGFHGLHVLIGTIFLAVCLVRSYTGTFSLEGHLGFEFAAWYWHFVDVVWLFLFIFVYWWGGQ